MSESRLNRRSFLRSLGILPVAAVVPAVAAPVPKPLTAFTFVCHCGRAIVAAVPPEKGMVVEQACECRIVWRLTWMGDHFTVNAQYPNDGSDIERVRLNG